MINKVKIDGSSMNLINKNISEKKKETSVDIY